MWFVIWVLLVLGALAVFVLIGLRLWRSAKELLKELGASAEASTRLAERIEELSAAQQDRQFTPDLVATALQQDRWRQQRAANLTARAARRQARRDRAYARWRGIGMPL